MAIPAKPKVTYHTKELRNDAMADLETLGTKDDAVILSIGAVIFDPFAEPGSLVNPDGTYNCKQFYEVLHVDTQKGRVIESSTLDWWRSADKAAAYKQITDYPNKVHLPDALDRLWDWLKENAKGGKIWACAPNFDVDMLSHAFRTCGISKMKGSSTDFPIPFWDNMDVRTIENFIFGGKYRQTKVSAGTYHNALDDCITQAMMVQEAGKRVREGLLCNVPVEEKQ